MNKSLLDTDTLSETTKGVDLTVVANAMAYRRAFGRYTISAVTVMEIVKGLQKNRSPRRLKAFLAAAAAMEILPLGRPEGELSGRIAGELERVGRSIGVADPMIAAVAIIHGLDLVTGNIAHFQRIQKLGYPLTLINWRI